MRHGEQRDEAWFTEAYAAGYPHIVNYGRRRLGDDDAAAELAQEVFIVAWRRRAEVPGRSLPWLYGVARRLLANRWRAERAAPPPLPMPAELPAGTDAGQGERLADVRAALYRLSEPDREILCLIGWEELTVSEAAQVLGCTRTTAAVRLHRARRRLTAALAATGGTQGAARLPEHHSPTRPSPERGSHVR